MGAQLSANKLEMSTNMRSAKSALRIWENTHTKSSKSN